MTMQSGTIWISIAASGSSTTVSAAQASGTVSIPPDAQGNTTGIRRKVVLTCLGTGGAHVRFLNNTTVGTAVTNDIMVTSDPKFFLVPGGCTTLAHIAANAVTSVLNIATVE